VADFAGVPRPRLSTLLVAQITTSSPLPNINRNTAGFRTFAQRIDRTDYIIGVAWLRSQRNDADAATGIFLSGTHGGCGCSASMIKAADSSGNFVTKDFTPTNFAPFTLEFGRYVTTGITAILGIQSDLREAPTFGDCSYFQIH